MMTTDTTHEERLATLRALVHFAEGYSMLGDAVTEQIRDALFGDATDANPNALQVGSNLFSDLRNDIMVSEMTHLSEQLDDAYEYARALLFNMSQPDHGGLCSDTCRLVEGHDGVCSDYTGPR